MPKRNDKTNGPTPIEIVNGMPHEAAPEGKKPQTPGKDEIGGERFCYSENHPAFKGAVEFDLTLELFGQRVTRKAQVHYEHTPDWEYWDLHKKALYVGWGATAWDFRLLTVPAEEEWDLPPDNDEEDDGYESPEPEWVTIDDITHLGVLTRNIWDAIDEAIEQQCKAEDAKRRKKAARGRRGK